MSQIRGREDFFTVELGLEPGARLRIVSGIAMSTLLALIANLTWTGATTGKEPDTPTHAAPDLETPKMVEGPPRPGLRVRAVAKPYVNTDVYHTLYLPRDWKPNRRYPVIVEYAGNGPYRNELGDICTGRVEDCNLGYGISGGIGFIWICLPYISEDHTRNQLQWWGDRAATVEYCKKVVAHVCQAFGGDARAILLVGFSRGAIACNFLGLANDDIARLWCGFVCHSHYDGVREWGYRGSDREAAEERLQRLNGRPQFISHETSVANTRTYLQAALPQGRFTFCSLPFPNHTDKWVLRPSDERTQLRNWVQRVVRHALTDD